MAWPIQLLIASQAALWEQAQQLATPWLSAQEQQRYQSLQTERRQREFMACRYGLRQVLGLSDTQLDKVHLSASEGSAPAVISHVSIPHPPSLSLAHSQDYVSCASGPFALGVDLEVLPSRRLRNIRDAAQLVCSSSELQMLGSMASDAERAERFIQCWVLKEAWFKCLGTGIDFQRITQISCCVPDAQPPDARVLGYGWMWQATDADARRLFWALCTAQPVVLPDIALSLEHKLQPLDVQPWLLLDM